jgi:hypothetical protein
VKDTIADQLAARQREIQHRLDPTRLGDCSRPVLTACNIHYEISERVHGVAYGGLGAFHLLARRIGLIDATDNNRLLAPAQPLEGGGDPAIRVEKEYLLPMPVHERAREVDTEPEVAAQTPRTQPTPEEGGDSRSDADLGRARNAGAAPADRIPGRRLPVSVLLMVAIGQARFKLLDELQERQAKNLADRSQLYDVQPAIAAFHLADERLRKSQFFRKFHLRDAGLVPGRAQQPQHHGVFTGVNGFFHPAIAFRLAG